MRKIIAPALLFTLGLLSLPLSIVSSLYLRHSADVGPTGAPAQQFDIPVAEMLPASIIMLVIGSAWLAYAVPRHVRVDDEEAEAAASELEPVLEPAMERAP